jgi:NAD-dependent dihydropyrimidine dehydrogenase PreA subunit
VIVLPIEKINQELCEGCGTCVDSCPMDVIRFDDDAQKAYIMYQKDCIACLNCEFNCPMNAIYVSSRRGRNVPPAWGA